MIEWQTSAIGKTNTPTAPLADLAGVGLAGCRGQPLLVQEQMCVTTWF